MLKIGCHLAIGGGYVSAGKTALSIDANTFQFFSRNPRGSSARAVDKKDIEAFNEFAVANNLLPTLAHAPYTLNACSADLKVRDFAKLVMASDLSTMQLLPGNYYNFHPGSHTGQGSQVGMDLIVNLLNEIVTQDVNTVVLLEAMSGKGSEVGSTFEELAEIINRCNYKEKMGVCLDTCHVYSAGYDIVGDLNGVLEKFDNVIGLDKLKAIHLNDSMMPFNSHKDRHEKIGDGTIGAKAIVEFINHEKLKHLPYYLETPNELDGYAKEIAFLRENYSV